MNLRVALVSFALLAGVAGNRVEAQVVVAGSTTVTCPATVYVQVRVQLTSLEDPSGWFGNIDQVPLHDAEIGVSPGGRQRLYCNYWVPGNAEESQVGAVHVNRFLSRDVDPGSCRVADDHRSFVCAAAAVTRVPIHRDADPPPPPIRRLPTRP